ncbi:portal protein [Photobacterium leiognathi]|uniref:portal protein n=2 Tax=Photobacterium leiognathi TaxID=553611 RepID=UPI0029823138|nr:portal protein [Photobacterium leiognathi]
MVDKKSTDNVNGSKLVNLMKKVFPFYNENDDKNYAAVYDTNGDYSASTFVDTNAEELPNGAIGIAGAADRDRIFIKSLPTDRLARYKIYKEMADDSTISAAIELLLSYALSADKSTGRCVFLRAKDPKDTELVDKLNREVLAPINKYILSWSYTTAVYGVNYIRPYTEKGRGIVAWEANYYTLPSHIKEYEKSGNLAGFTSQNLKQRQDGEQVQLAEPWILIPLKIPSWHPDLDVEPNNYTGTAYSLYDDAYHRIPIETQNYGTSLIHTAFESWCNLKQAMHSLLASRANASRIDRLISVSTDNLDPARAAEYINSVATQLKSDREEASRMAEKSGVLPTVWNSLIPVMSGGAKGGVSIDTQVIEPNITAIEDIMFYVKQMGGALGIDPSLLGFGDMMAGGLGEGGWFRTAIQSALRANLLRGAAVNFIYRAIDIHTAFKDGKVWTDGEYPFDICFDSLNTAIEEEANAANEAKANYASLVATALDTIEQGMIGKSDTLKGYIYKDILELDPVLSDKIIKELAEGAAAMAAENDSLMESIGDKSQSELEQIVRDVLLGA